MINSADIEHNGFKWAMADQLPALLRSIKTGKPFIINTDISGNPGVHWITAVRASDGKFFIYDSLGASNFRGTSQGNPIDGLLTKVLAGGDASKIILYRPQTQYDDNTLCGYHALIACKEIQRLFSHKKATCDDLCQLFAHLFDKKPSRKNLRVLANAFH